MRFLPDARALARLPGRAALVALIAAAPARRGPEPAATYLERFEELTRLAPSGQVAAVSHLVLTRDVGTITMESGQLALLDSVGGRVVGAVFTGSGRFRFEPPEPVEQRQLRGFADTTVLDVPITEVILLFADSTAAAFGDLRFARGEAGDGVRAHVRDLMQSLRGERNGTFDVDVMAPMLNGDTSGFFMARVSRRRGGPVLFRVDDSKAEAVDLLKPVSRRDYGAAWAVVTRFPGMRQAAEDTRGWRSRDRLDVTSYALDVRLTEQFSADLSIAVGAVLTVSAHETVGPWLPFRLDARLEVDSARWTPGAPAFAFKADEDGLLWLRAPRVLQRGDSLRLEVWYHGTMIDRYGNWFFVDPGAAWYPMGMLGNAPAGYDITYHSPARYPLISIGTRADSSRAGNEVTTRWVTASPAQHATFNLGLFDALQVHHEGAPALTVMMSDDAHRLLARQLARIGYVLAEQRNMSRNVAADISNALALFTTQFGDPPFDHFWVTEIPYDEGVSFPGLIDLSWGTFQETSLDGFDEFFRAHEAAHQWWGNAVRPASYRDAWLSEGLATYSGLSYLQTARHRNDDYYRFLDQYRSHILARRDNGLAVALGWRNGSPDAPRGYQQMVYEKGAWTFHMLRLLMLDLNTLRADRFTELLRDYYARYRGRVASTDDFQRLLEERVGVNMDWFFEQWVRGTDVPSYRVAWRTEPADNGRFRVRMRVTQEHVPATFRMPVLIAADLGGGRTARYRIEVHGGQAEYLSPLLPGEPRAVTFNDFRSVLAEVHNERW